MLATIRDRLRGSVAEATKRGAVSREAQREATSDQARLANLHPGVIQRAVSTGGACCLFRTPVPIIRFWANGSVGKKRGRHDLYHALVANTSKDTFAGYKL